MSSALLAHVVRRREALIERFLAEVQDHDVAPEGLSRSALLDSLPAFFEQLIRALRETRPSLVDPHLPAAAEHGADRWRQGFDLRAVVREYGVLENVLLKDLDEHGIAPSSPEIRALLNCLNGASAEAVTAYTEEADQVRRTLDEKQTALGAIELRLQMVAAHVPQIIWTADAKGQVEWYNARWFDFTGLEVSASSGWGWVGAIHPEDRERCKQRWARAVATGEPYETESRVRRHDGVYRWLLTRAVPVADAAGNIANWLGSSTDIDDQKNTEARVSAAREEGERLNRLKDEFLATVSHELRTPLQSILGWARLLRSGHMNPEQNSRALETIERNARVQSQLIEDILDVSRIITGKAYVQTEVVDVAAVLGAALDTTQPAARAKGVELTAEVPSDIGTVMGDADRLQQVVWNLMSNAVKFTPRGGHVRLTASRGPSTLEIVVTDDGQGIAPGFLPFVFDRFRQADAGVARAHGGLGLGLAIVRHLVELHGGRVSATSDGPAKGSAFHVHLPVGGTPAVFEAVSPAKPQRSDPPNPVLAALAGLRVLVVEDQPDARELVATILRQYGAEVHEAGSAREALRILEHEELDLLVSDIGMPLEDGYALIQAVRAMSQHPRVAKLPALALTAYARAEDRKHALDSGYDLHVAKPIEPGKLVAAVIEVTLRAS